MNIRIDNIFTSLFRLFNFSDTCYVENGLLYECTGFEDDVLQISIRSIDKYEIMTFNTIKWIEKIYWEKVKKCKFEGV